MKKYWTLFSVALQEAFSERGSALIYSFLDFLWPFTNLFIWLAIYENQGGREAFIGGFSLSQILIYYLGVALISAVATAHSEWDVSREIRDGDLSLYLVRPLSYATQHFLENIAWKLIKGLLVLPFLLLTFFLFRGYLQLGFSFFSLLSFLLALALSYLLYFFNAMTLGLLAFWVEEPGSFIELNDLVRALFSGMAIPLSFLPGIFLGLGKILPYRYLYDFPLQIFTGRLDGQEIFFGLMMQFLWLAAFFFLYRFLWQKGLARYSAVGG